MKIESERVVKDTTAIVATYEREQHLGELIDSFRSAYNGLKFVVADNSVNKYPRNDVTYVPLEAGSGISISRNKALEKVQTPYTLLVDDDHVCISETKLESLLSYLIKNKLDIVAGDQREAHSEPFEFHGQYQFDRDRLLHYVAIPRADHGSWTQFDTTPNFFVARTDKLKKLMWTPELRFAKEHDDFFLRAMKDALKVSFLSDVAVLNNSVARHHGGNRGEASEELFRATWNISDKIEIRWIRTPYPRLSFYSTRYKALIEPTKDDFEKAVRVFSKWYKDFSVLNPFSA